MGFEDLLNRIDALKSFNTMDEFENIVQSNSQRLVELEQEQLAAGIDSRGKFRVDQYRPLTKFIKQTQGIGLGAVTDRVTFFMTGQLYKSLFAKITKETFAFESPLPTYGKMLERIGEENFGLSPEQKKEFTTEIVVPQFSVIFKQKTGIEL